jgi:hypothetical protein
MIDLYSKDNIKNEGKVDYKFKVWLDCNFGYYTQGLLIDYCWDSTVVYQYDSKLGKLRSTYNEISLDSITDWRIYDDNGELVLAFYEGDVAWCAYVMSWLIYNKPEYVILPQ